MLSNDSATDYVLLTIRPRQGRFKLDPLRLLPRAQAANNQDAVEWGLHIKTNLRVEVVIRHDEQHSQVNFDLNNAELALTLGMLDDGVAGHDHLFILLQGSFTLPLRFGDSVEWDDIRDLWPTGGRTAEIQALHLDPSGLFLRGVLPAAFFPNATAPPSVTLRVPQQTPFALDPVLDELFDGEIRPTKKKFWMLTAFDFNRADGVVTARDYVSACHRYFQDFRTAKGKTFLDNVTSEPGQDCVVYLFERTPAFQQNHFIYAVAQRHNTQLILGGKSAAEAAFSPQFLTAKISRHQSNPWRREWLRYETRTLPQTSTSVVEQSIALRLNLPRTGQTATDAELDIPTDAPLEAIAVPAARLRKTPQPGEVERWRSWLCTEAGWLALDSSLPATELEPNRVTYGSLRGVLELDRLWSDLTEQSQLGLTVQAQTLHQSRVTISLAEQPATTIERQLNIQITQPLLTAITPPVWFNPRPDEAGGEAALDLLKLPSLLAPPNPSQTAEAPAPNPEQVLQERFSPAVFISATVTKKLIAPVVQVEQAGRRWLLDDVQHERRFRLRKQDGLLKVKELKAVGEEDFFDVPFPLGAAGEPAPETELNQNRLPRAVRVAFLPYAPLGAEIARAPLTAALSLTTQSRQLQLKFAHRPPQPGTLSQRLTRWEREPGLPLVQTYPLSPTRDESGYLDANRGLVPRQPDVPQTLPILFAARGLPALEVDNTQWPIETSLIQSRYFLPTLPGIEYDLSQGTLQGTYRHSVPVLDEAYAETREVADDVHAPAGFQAGRDFTRVADTEAFSLSTSPTQAAGWVHKTPTHPTGKTDITFTHSLTGRHPQLAVTVKGQTSADDQSLMLKREDRLAGVTFKLKAEKTAPPIGEQLLSFQVAPDRDGAHEVFLEGQSLVAAWDEVRQRVVTLDGEGTVQEEHYGSPRLLRRLGQLEQPRHTRSFSLRHGIQLAFVDIPEGTGVPTKFAELCMQRWMLHDGVGGWPRLCGFPLYPLRLTEFTVGAQGQLTIKLEAVWLLAAPQPAEPDKPHHSGGRLTLAFTCDNPAQPQWQLHLDGALEWRFQLDHIARTSQQAHLARLKARVEHTLAPNENECPVQVSELEVAHPIGLFSLPLTTATAVLRPAREHGVLALAAIPLQGQGQPFQFALGSCEIATVKALPFREYSFSWHVGTNPKTEIELESVKAAQDEVPRWQWQLRHSGHPLLSSALQPHPIGRRRFLFELDQSTQRGLTFANESWFTRTPQQPDRGLVGAAFDSPRDEANTSGVAVPRLAAFSADVLVRLTDKGRRPTVELVSPVLRTAAFCARLPVELTSVACLGARWVLLGGADGSLTARDLETSTQLRRTPQRSLHNRSISALAALNERTVVAAGLDGWIDVWELASDQVISHKLASVELTCLAALSEEYVCVGGADGRVYIWKIGTQEVTSRVLFTQPVTAIAALDPQHIVAGNADGRLKIWRWEVTEETELAPQSHLRINTLTVAAATTFYAGDAGGQVTQWQQTETGWSPSSMTYASAVTASVWSTRKQLIIGLADGELFGFTPGRKAGYKVDQRTQPILALAAMADGRVAVGSADSGTRLLLRLRCESSNADSGQTPETKLTCTATGVLDLENEIRLTEADSTPCQHSARLYFDQVTFDEPTLPALQALLNGQWPSTETGPTEVRLGALALHTLALRRPSANFVLLQEEASNDLLPGIATTSSTVAGVAIPRVAGLAAAPTAEVFSLVQFRAAQLVAWMRADQFKAKFLGVAPGTDARLVLEAGAVFWLYQTDLPNGQGSVPADVGDDWLRLGLRPRQPQLPAPRQGIVVRLPFAAIHSTAPLHSIMLQPTANEAAHLYPTTGAQWTFPLRLPTQQPTAAARAARHTPFPRTAQADWLAAQFIETSLTAVDANVVQLEKNLFHPGFLTADNRRVTLQLPRALGDVEPLRTAQAKAQSWAAATLISPFQPNRGPQALTHSALLEFPFTVEEIVGEWSVETEDEKGRVSSPVQLISLVNGSLARVDEERIAGQRGEELEQAAIAWARGRLESKRLASGGLVLIGYQATKVVPQPFEAARAVLAETPCWELELAHPAAQAPPLVNEDLDPRCRLPRPSPVSVDQAGTALTPEDRLSWLLFAAEPQKAPSELKQVAATRFRLAGTRSSEQPTEPQWRGRLRPAQVQSAKWRTVKLQLAEEGASPLNDYELTDEGTVLACTKWDDIPFEQREQNLYPTLKPRAVLEPSTLLDQQPLSPISHGVEEELITLVPPLVDVIAWAARPGERTQTNWSLNQFARQNASVPRYKISAAPVAASELRRPRAAAGANEEVRLRLKSQEALANERFSYARFELTQVIDRTSPPTITNPLQAMLVSASELFPSANAFAQADTAPALIYYAETNVTLAVAPTNVTLAVAPLQFILFAHQSFQPGSGAADQPRTVVLWQRNTTLPELDDPPAPLCSTLGNEARDEWCVLHSQLPEPRTGWKSMGGSLPEVYQLEIPGVTACLNRLLKQPGQQGHQHSYLIISQYRYDQNATKWKPVNAEKPLGALRIELLSSKSRIRAPKLGVALLGFQPTEASERIWLSGYGRLDDKNFSPLTPHPGAGQMEWTRTATLQTLERMLSPQEHTASPYQYDVILYGSGGELIKTVR
jgi:WD40 repeat protein